MIIVLIAIYMVNLGVIIRIWYEEQTYEPMNIVMLSFVILI